MTLLIIISGNFTASLSETTTHSFFIAPNIFLNSSTPSYNKYDRNWSRFDQENFALDYFSVNCDNLMLVSNMNVDKLH